jgi:hypothetical protein
LNYLLTVRKPQLERQPGRARPSVRSRLSTVVLTVVAAASLGTAFGVVPASAAVGRAAATTVSCQSPFTVGSTYRANDFDGYYLSWNGVFKGQMRTTGTASTLYVHAYTSSVSEGICGWYMFEVENSNGTRSGNCLEYDGTDTAVIADTCTSTRASQWWYFGGPAGSFNFLDNQYNGCNMVADGGDSGSLVTCGDAGSDSPQGDYQWKIYAHS